MIVLPRPAVEALGDTLGLPACRAFRAKMMPRYVAALRPKMPAVKPDASEQDLIFLASATFDALMFAGGLSVASVISCALATAYATHSPAVKHGWTPAKREAASVPQLVWEVVRYFPPVVGFPWWEMRGEHAGRRTLLSLAMANRDPRVWGSDAEEFKLRPLSQYHKLAGVAWADLAVDGNMSRSCPAKDLSIVLASEFLEAWFDAQPSKWELPAEDAAAIKFTASTPFVSTFAFQPTKE